MEQQITVRHISEKELGILMEWAAAEGWNPGLNDAAVFYNTDPDGFFMAFDKKGEAVGGISAVSYGPDFGFIGLYIVKPGCRGHRIGIELGQAAIDYMGGRNIGLDGVEKKLKNYAAHGFKMAHRNMRFEGIGNGDFFKDDSVIALGPEDLDKINEFDKMCFPSARRKFLELWISSHGSKTAGVIENGKLLGYAVSRPCISGFKIGPLFAENTAIAEKLFRRMSAEIGPKQKLYIDIPEHNPGALKLAERYGMKRIFCTARMYSREFPEIHLNKIFGISSFELG